MTGDNTTGSNQQPQDIIDVTGQTVRISQTQQTPELKQQAVPYWNHTYVDSYDDIRYATKVQTDFYQYFKQQFLKGDYLDLQGNNNYAFVLLFDLLKQSTDMVALEKNLRILRKYYSQTRPYTLSFLADKMKAIGDKAGESRLRQEIYGENNSSRLGTKYKPLLKLDKISEELLNKIWYPGNNFYDVPFCQLEIIKLFLTVRIELQLSYNAAQQTRDQQFKFVADVIARKQYRYRTGSDNYNYCIQSSIAELYTLILKYCENAVREHYEHKRKLSIDNYAIAEIDTAVEDIIISKVKTIIAKEISYVRKPDEETQMELNAQNTTRWKIKLNELENGLVSKDSDWFLKEVQELGRMNQKNPSVENIYFEASKIIAKKDRITALVLYLHYLLSDLNSAVFDNKPIAVRLQKSLFDDAQQAKDFEAITQTLTRTKDLKAAIEAVKQLHLPKRKKIQLDQTGISETDRKYQDTVELLNGVLQEEEAAIETPVVNTYAEVKQPVFTQGQTTLTLNEGQAGLLQLFADQNFCLSPVEVGDYAKSAGMFPNQLVESINDVCYELIDDLLIEEENTLYTINENQYRNIFSK